MANRANKWEARHIPYQHQLLCEDTRGLTLVRVAHLEVELLALPRLRAIELHEFSKRPAPALPFHHDPFAHAVLTIST